MSMTGSDIRELTDNGLAEAAGLISRREYNLSIVRARQTAEFIIKSYASEKGIQYTTLADTIEELYAQGIINRTSRDAFHNIRIYGNKAVHDGDNDPENAQKAYYLLKSEVSTFLSRKTVSVDRTPVRVGASSESRLGGDLEIELEEDGRQRRRNHGSVRESGDSFESRVSESRSVRSDRNSSSDRSNRSSQSSKNVRRSEGGGYDPHDDSDLEAHYGNDNRRRSGSTAHPYDDEDSEAIVRDIQRRFQEQNESARRNAGLKSGERRSNERRSGQKRSSGGQRRNQNGSGRRSSGRSTSGRASGGRSSGRSSGGRRSSGASGSFTIYDLLRILIPIFVIILLIVIIRSFTASNKPVETTEPMTAETVIEETTTVPVTEPETTEPETTEPAVYEYKTNTDGVNIRYADNQNRIYTQLPKDTNIGVVTPIEGSDFGSFTLDGVNVVVNMNFVDPIEN